MNNGIQTYIFDLDGTLYDFEGKKFSESKLGIQIRDRYFDIISQNNLGEPKSTYAKMLEKEHVENIGISIQLAQLLGKTRKEVLSWIWGEINPEGIIKNYNYSKLVLERLRGHNKSIFLVTGAPKIWALKALDHMELSRYFEQIFGIEEYSESKKEPFIKIQLMTGAQPEGMISIGDQEITDLMPAKELGMHVFHVMGPQDLLKLL